MMELRGNPISPGYGAGMAVIFHPAKRGNVRLYRIELDDVAGECKRFREALDRSCREVERIEYRVRREVGQFYSSIFAAHTAFLCDKQFNEKVEQRIRDDLVNAEWAVDEEISGIAASLAAVENEYIRERSQDIRDVGMCLIRQLARHDPVRENPLSPSSVLVAQELLPSETIGLDRQCIVAIVTEKGGENSHAAILARALNIPAVTGVNDVTSVIASGVRLLIDGVTGRVSVMPTMKAEAVFAADRQRYIEAAAKQQATTPSSCVTLDGNTVALLGNINRVEDASQVVANHLQGVGLFRTEFLYLDASEPPTSTRHKEVYRQVCEMLQGRPVVIRTLDMGGDKIPAFLSLRGETPNLELRGLQFSLAYPDLFREQLRAIVDVAASHDVRVMFPMVLGESDFLEGNEQLQAIAAEAGASKLPPVGAMIETPASLFALDEILPLADFVSIGTNDLTQFILAADRNVAGLDETYSVLHPSVLRAIRKVVEACDAAGCELCVCGEAAGDPDIAPLLVGLGVYELSMIPARATSIRHRLCNLKHSELETLAQKVMSARSGRAVKKLLSQF